MSPILIQGAMRAEIDYFLEIIENKKEEIYGGYKFYEGELDGYPVAISETGIGLVNAAASTTIGIIKYNPIAIFNQGTAGGHGRDVRRNDIVIGTDSINITSFMTKNKREGQGSDIEDWKISAFDKQVGEDFISNKIEIKSDSNLLQIANKVSGLYTIRGST